MLDKMDLMFESLEIQNSRKPLKKDTLLPVKGILKKRDIL